VKCPRIKSEADFLKKLEENFNLFPKARKALTNFVTAAGIAAICSFFARIFATIYTSFATKGSAENGFAAEFKAINQLIKPARTEKTCKCTGYLRPFLP